MSYSEEAQQAAKVVLEQTYTDPGATLLSMKPFMEDDDIPGANLVLETWLRVGANLVALTRFARANRDHEDYYSILNWFKEELLGPETKFDIQAETRKAKAWLDSLD